MTLISQHKRTFIKNVLCLGSAATLWPTVDTWGQTNQAEMDKRRSARHILTFCSPYDTAQADYSPHMHAQIKRNIEQFSNGKIYVDIKDKGQMGIGTELMAKVSRGHINAALVSVSNLSPAAPALDVLNIPFWSAQNQAYLNLITSTTWQRLIVDRIRKQGNIDILFHYLPGPRTATSTRNFKRPLKTPDDLKNIVFRVPASKVLGIYYQLAGTNPVNVAWKDVALLARNGRIDALDPGIIGLYNGPGGLRDHIGTISLINSVHDGWVAVINQHWLAKLTISEKEALFAAAEQTFREHLAQITQITQNCSAELKRRGVDIYQPNDQESAHWIACCGHQKPQWQPVKRRLLGDEKVFDELLEATKATNGYTL